MSDAEWQVFEPYVVARGAKRGRPPAGHRRTLDGIFWTLRTGAPWRDLPDVFGKWNSVFQQFRRWSEAGLWDAMLEALNASNEAQASVQMIDSTVVRAHQHAAGAKKGALTQARLRAKLLAARAAASRPRST